MSDVVHSVGCGVSRSRGVDYSAILGGPKERTWETGSMHGLLRMVSFSIQNMLAWAGIPGNCGKF